MIDFKTGDKFFLNRKSKGFLFWKKGEGSWFSSAQRLFTGIPITHCASVMPKFFDTQYVISADEDVTLNLVEDYLAEELTDLYVYRPIGVDEQTALLVAKRMLPHIGKVYDFLQLLWFPIIAALQGIQRLSLKYFNLQLKYNTKLWNNPFAKDTLDICSELEYHELQYLNEYMQWPDLAEKLSQFNENSCCAGDIWNICRELPNRFECIYESIKN